MFRLLFNDSHHSNILYFNGCFLGLFDFFVNLEQNPNDACELLFNQALASLNKILPIFELSLDLIRGGIIKFKKK